jgi:hypothetical protein
MYALRWKVVVCAAICAVATGVAAGQASVIARRESEITPFGQLTYLRPDSGLNSNVGFTTGMAFTPYIPLLIQPSLEVRFSDAFGDFASERTFSGGLKLAVRLHRFHPYGIAEEGLGGIYFAHPTRNNSGKLYVKDASRIYVAGGGLEVDVHSLWQVRVEFTQQFWNLRPPTLRPVTASIGVTYRIPFRKGVMK